MKRRIFLSVILIFTIVLNSLPVFSQDFISTADDISNGSSVFVSRRAVNAKQVKAAFIKTKTKRAAAKRTESRKKIAAKAVEVRKKKPRAKAVAPKVKAPPTTKPPKKNQKPTKPQIDYSEEFAVGGDVYMDRNEVDKAIALYKKSLEFNPANKAAKQGLSEGLTLKADTVLEKALSPGDGISGDEYSPESAAALYLEATEFDKTNAAAYAGLGEAYDSIEDKKGSNENRDKAIAAYEKALALSADLTELFVPLGILYFQKNEIAKAENYLAKAVQADAKDPETQYFLGLVRYKQNKDDEALAALKASIKGNPNFADAHYYLGEVYDRLGQDKDAIKAYQDATRLNPRYLEAWFDLGVAQYNNEKYDDAINAYNQVKKIDSTYTMAYLNLADVYRRQKKFDNAVSEYNIGAVFAERSNEFSAAEKAEIFNNFAYCLGKSSKWDSAVTQLNKAISIKADDIDYTNLGWAYYNSGKAAAQANDQAKATQRFNEAKIALEKAVQMNPKAIGALLNLGMTYTDLSQFKEASVVLKSAIENSKNDSKNKLVTTFAYNELGAALVGLKDFALAVDALNSAVGLNDKFAAAFYNLGVAHANMGNESEARAAQSKLKKLNPNMAKILDATISITLKSVKDKAKGKVNDEIRKNNPINKLPIRIPYE